MLKAIIIDNELNARKSLSSDLLKFCPSVTVVGEAEGVESGIDLIKKAQPEIVFLDVEMDDGTGFDLLEKLKQKKLQIDFHLIFTTAYEKYAIKAIKFSALDFLLKPVVVDELIAAITKAVARGARKVEDASLSALLNNIGKMDKGGPKHIVLTTADEAAVYKTDDIIKCESDRNYTKFYFSNDSPLLVSKTLKEFDDLLTDSGFERVHKSYLVNLSYVKKFIKTDGGYLVLKDGSTIPVSQRKRDSIMSKLSSF